MKLNIIILLLAMLLSLKCSSDISGTSSDVDIKIGSIKGKLVDIEGQAVENASVKLYDGDEFDSLSQSAAEVETDSLGYYNFSLVKSGKYHMQADFNDSLFAARRNIRHYIDSFTNLDIDTMLAPGVLSGVVLTDKENHMGVLVYIPGTHYSAYTDSLGSFIMGGVAPGIEYSLACQMYGYATTVINNISIKSGDTTEIDTIKLVRNLFPTGLDAIYDTSNSTVVLKWNTLQKEDIVGYNIYRKDSRNSSQYPALLNVKLLISDTFFVDTIDETIFSREDSIPLQYQVKAKNIREDLSPFSDKYYVTVHTLRDSLTLKTLDVISPKYKDQYRGDSIITLQWDYTGILGTMEIQYTANNGKSWFTISSEAENKGQLDWNLPNISSDSCRIKIKSSVDTLLYDMSDIFSIKASDNKNLLKNGDFSSGMAEWNFKLFEDGKGSVRVVDGVCIITTDTVPGEPWYVAVNQGNLPLMKGKFYRLSFDANSTVDNHSVGFTIALNEIPWTTYDSHIISISTDTNHYSIKFLMSQTDNLESVIIINPASEKADLSIDNLVLEEVE